MTTRVSGTKIFHSVEALKNAGLAIASPQDPKYQQSSDIASIAIIANFSKDYFSNYTIYASNGSAAGEISFNIIEHSISLIPP